MTFLPSDRLSQVTKRGMLTDKTSQTKRPAASQSKEWQFGYQRETGLNRSPSEGSAAGRGIPREQKRAEEREEMDRSELDRLLDVEESDSSIVRISLFYHQRQQNPAVVDGK